MEVQEELLATGKTEAIQTSPKSMTILPSLALDMSPFEGLINRPLELMGAQFFLPHQLSLNIWSSCWWCLYYTRQMLRTWFASLMRPSRVYTCSMWTFEDI